MCKSQTCCFLGHRDSSEKIRPLLYVEIEKHIVQYNITTFYLGDYGNFDRMSLAVLHDLKRKYPHIEIVFVRAYLPIEKRQDMKRIYMT